MKYLHLILLPLAVSFCSSAGADSVPVQGDKEQALINSMEQAEQKALAAANERAIGKPLEVTAKPAKEQKSNAKTSDQMLQELVNEVDRLRSKEVVTKISALSTQKPRPARHIGAKTMYSYKEGDTYEVHTALDRVTDIELQPGEVLSNAPVAGDTVRWKIGIIKSGKAPREVTHVVLKPLDVDLETNLLLTTSKHVYHIHAVSGDWYMPAVAWNYPQEEDAELALALSRQNSTERVGTSPEELHFDYHIEDKDYDWRPVRAFDDGQKTYLQMPQSLKVTEAPALFLIEDGKPMLVNYRVKGDYYIIDRLIEQLELRVGPRKRIQVYGPNARPSLLERIFE